MTAEERMAYFQGEKQRNQKEKNYNLIFLKLRFFCAVVLFVLFLSLDYTGYEIQGIGSESIISEVITDFDMTAMKLPKF